MTDTDIFKHSTPDLYDRYMAPLLFEPFNSTKEDGMGVGLSICRTIVEAHHGRISVESEPGTGTTFRFKLPAPGVGDDGA